MGLGAWKLSDMKGVRLQRGFESRGSSVPRMPFLLALQELRICTELVSREQPLRPVDSDFWG